MVKFSVNSFELSEAMSKSKENHNSSIILTLENVDKPTHITLDFINDLGEKTIPSTRVMILENPPRHSIVSLPDFLKASTLTTNAQELKRIFMSQTVLSPNVEITMQADKVTFTVLPTDAGRGTCEAYHDCEPEEFKGYSEENVFVQCPKHICDRNTIKINPAHSAPGGVPTIKQIFKLSTLAFCEKPTTKSNRVVLAMTPDKALIIRYKIWNFGFVTYYIDTVRSVLTTPTMTTASSVLD